MRFYIPGEPCGKARPRVVRQGAFSRAYTPKKTVDYENLVKREYQNQCGGYFIESGKPIRMELKVFYRIPKGASKKTARDMRNGVIRPLKKPDSSNVCKAVEDALNGIAYHDDSQIVETVILRYYSDTPRVEVMIADATGRKMEVT